MKSTALAAFLILVWMSAQAVPALAAPESVTSALARTGTASCKPALAFFCRNIHVRCSGRSTIPTFAFDITINAGQAVLKPTGDNGEATMAPRSGPVEWANDQAYVIVWLRPRPGYLKIAADGRYIFRHYFRDTGYMSYGSCR